MILTVNLNPSVDKRYVIDDFKLNNVFRTQEYEYTAGGKGLNVSKVLKTLREDIMTTGFIGGSNGKFIIDKLNSMEIKHDFIKIGENTRSCLNIISKDGETEILESGPNISLEENNHFLQLYKKLILDVDIVSGSGSMAKGLPVDYYGELIKIANENNVKFILDTSGKALEYGIKAKPYLIKPNRKEIEELIGRKNLSEIDIIDYGLELNNFGIKIVVVSLGEEGALLITDNKVYKGKIESQNIRNPVGSGDSMVAGMIKAIVNNLNSGEILKYGIVAGTANAMEDETGKIDLNIFNSLLNKIMIEKLY